RQLLSNPTVNKFFDVNAFSIPASNIGRFGNCSVGTLPGPHTLTFSMSAVKTVHAGERFSIVYETQFANLVNFNNWALPNTEFSNSSFGLISYQQDGRPGSGRTSFHTDGAAPEMLAMSSRACEWIEATDEKGGYATSY